MTARAPSHNWAIMRQSAIIDLATLAEDEISGDKDHDRAPDVTDVVVAAMDLLASGACDAFTETDAGCRLPAVEYETDGDGYVHSEPASLMRWGWKGARQRLYVADHEARLRTLMLHG